MKISIRCFSILRDLAGDNILDLDFPTGTTVGGLLDYLQTGSLEKLGNFITSGTEELKPYVKLVRSGELQTPGKNTPVFDGDEFHLFVATSGAETDMGEYIVALTGQPVRFSEFGSSKNYLQVGIMCQVSLPTPAE